MIEIRLLRNALVLAEHASFARAALALNISQPTLSRNIQALEQAVGARLFDRLARSTVPTPTGEELLRHARTVLAASRALDDGMQQFLGLHSGAVTVGAGIAAAGGILGPSLAHFHASYPEVGLNAVVEDWRRLPEALRNGEIDLFVGEISECSDSEDLDIALFPHHQVYFFCRHGHPLLALPSLAVRDVLKWALVIPDLPARVEDMLCALGRSGDGSSDNAAVSSELLRLRAIKSNNLALNLQLVANTDTVGLATFGMLEEQLLRGEFALLPLRLAELCTNYGLVTRRGMSLSPMAQLFAEILREEDAVLADRERAYIRG